jgi:hypothetical protein
MSDDPQAIWDDYYRRIKARRLAQADRMWAEMTAAGVSNETVLALDFEHISNVRADANDLASQLSENYEMEVIPADREGYWIIKGTTRPDGICLSKEQHSDWVDFMADVARSYACVFSDWKLEAPMIRTAFESSAFDE